MKQQLIDIDMARQDRRSSQAYGQQEAQGSRRIKAAEVCFAANDIAPLFGTSKADRMAVSIPLQRCCVDFNMLQKRKNPDYDPNVTGSKMFLTDKSVGNYTTLYQELKLPTY